MVDEDGLIDQALLRWDGRRGFGPVAGSLGAAESEQLYQHRLLGVLDVQYRGVDAPRSLCFARLPAQIDEQQRWIIFCRAPGEAGGRVGTVVHALVGGRLDAGVALGLGRDWRGARDGAGEFGWLLPEPPGSMLADPEPPARLRRLEGSKVREIAQLRLGDRKYEARLAASGPELVRLVEGLLRAGTDRLAVFGWRSDPVVLLTAAREMLRNYVSDDWSFSTGESAEKSLFRITFILPNSRAVAVDQYVELDQDPAESQHWLDASKLVDAYQQRSPADWQQDLTSAGVEDGSSLLDWARNGALSSRQQLEIQLVELPGLWRRVREQQEELERFENLRPENEKTVVDLRVEVAGLRDRLAKSEAHHDRWQTRAKALEEEIARWADESRWLTDRSRSGAADFRLLGPVAEDLFGLRERVTSWEVEAARLLDRRSRGSAEFRFLQPVAEELFGLRADREQWQQEAGLLLARRRPAATEFQLLRRAAEELFRQRDMLARWEMEAEWLSGRAGHDLGQFVHLRQAAELVERLRSGQLQADMRSELERWQNERQWILQEMVTNPEAFDPLQPVAAMVLRLMTENESATQEMANLQRQIVDLQNGQMDWYEYAEDLRERLNPLRARMAAIELAAMPGRSTHAGLEPGMEESSGAAAEPIMMMATGEVDINGGEILPGRWKEVADEIYWDIPPSIRGSLPEETLSTTAQSDGRTGPVDFLKRRSLELNVAFLVLLIAALMTVLLVR